MCKGRLDCLKTVQTGEAIAVNSVVKIAYLCSSLLLPVKVSKQGQCLPTDTVTPEQEGSFRETSCVQRQHSAAQQDMMNVTAGFPHYGALGNVTTSSTDSCQCREARRKRVSKSDRWRNFRLTASAALLNTLGHDGVSISFTRAT